MIYLLAVGIGSYSNSQIPRLTGPRNDVRALKNLFAQHFGEKLAFKSLMDYQARYEDIIHAFEHLKQAQAGDTAIFYFSGHGSRVRSAPEFEPYNSDNRDESLVCFDSRESAPDLTDKELVALFSEVGREGVRMLGIFDCCHSGSMLKSVDLFGGAVARHAPESEDEPRAFEAYYGYQLWRANGDIRIPERRMVTLSACRNVEQALETDIEGQRMGVFTDALLRVLDESWDASYSDLFFRLKRALWIPSQSPQIECFDGAGAWEAFPGAGSLSHQEDYPVFFEDQGWKVKLGAIHGLLHPVEIEVLDSEQKPVCAARMSSLGLDESPLTLDTEGFLDPEVTYAAGLRELPFAPLLVEVESGAEVPFESPLGVLWTEIKGNADFGLWKAENAWHLWDQSQDCELGVFAEAGLDDLRLALHKIRTWKSLLAL